LEEIKPYRHSVGHSYRSHVAIEPYLSDQWYCQVTEPRMAGAALRAIADDQFEGRKIPGKADTWDGGMRFFPSRYARTFQSWHENIRDWCISRQLWWGHRIPVWRLPEGRLGERLPLAQFEAIVEKLAQWQADGRIALTQRAERDQARSVDIADRSLPYTFACVHDPNDREVIDELERHGAAQDPDVLDTWFSSGLWPLSTLGWPEETPELRTWNPSSVLCTSREIITLWVSRMTMFNIHFRNTLPFRDVFIHAMIQDGHGQKMSKSLGNGVDPMDIIASHGADAMRFTLAHMATNTQDVRMPVDLVDPWTGETFAPKYVTDSAGYMVAAPIQESPKDPSKKMVSSYGLASGKIKPTADMPLAKNTSSKFDLGRNFCNKLWNAARFVLSNIESAPAEAPDESKWSLADRWIISRFNRTVAETDDVLKNYRFDQVARAAYDFFWRDFCDWYVEAVKPAMRDPSRAGQTANVLAAVLDGALRLLHPIIPFITEIIYHRLNEIRPTRGLPNRLECPHSGISTQHSGLLIKAPWPNVGSFAEAAEHIFPNVQEVIGVIRNVRNELKVPPKQKVDVYIAAPPEPTRQLTENREMIEVLATVNLKDVHPDLTAPAGAVRAAAAGVEVFVHPGQPAVGDTNLAEKRCAELKKLADTLRGRLSNDAYTKKAPPHLVQQTRDQLAQAEAEIDKLGCG
jgi:valyl-tRNA synthetase